MPKILFTSPSGVLVVLAGITAFFFFLAKKTRWKIFNYFPPLMFIYAVPVLLSNPLLFPNFCVIPNQSPVYGWMQEVILPMFLIFMLLNVDLMSTIKVMGKGVFVMLFGTAGVILGAPIAYFIVKSRLGPEAWKGFGTLAGGWIGGNANMAAVSESIGTSGTDFGLAILAANLVNMVWLPIMLGSKNFAGWFNKFARVDPRRIEMLEHSAGEIVNEKGKFEMVHLLYLLFLGLFFPALAAKLSAYMPVVDPILTQTSWKVLLVTTFGISLSMTPARKIPGSHEIGMAFIYLFVACMGAKASLAGLAEQAPWFVAGAFIWIFMHGGLCVLGAWLFRVDIHSTAIASAANIGGAASAPIVAAHHNEKLVPASVLMALIGYSIGNYGGLLAAQLCLMVS